MIKERIIYLDYLRCIACLMVILMHSPMPNLGTNSLILSAISYLSAPCIGLFFMVSGALLLPIAGTSHTFLTKRCSKIVYPTLFWYLSIFVAIIAMTWFAIIQKNVSLIHSSRIKKYIIRFSNYSFGIYLIHILVMRYILWKVALISQLGGVIQIILTFILTIVISYLLISCVSKFKFAQYIIGYSEHKK